MGDQEAERICAGCGASSAPEALYCGVCGQALSDTTESSESGDNWLPDSLSPGLQQANTVSEASAENGAGVLEGDYAGENETGSAVSEEQVAQKRCGWCSNLNPWVAAVCQHCGAHFPIPEQDEAFRRAAEERMRQDLETLNFMVRQRKRRGWRRFF